MYKIFEDTNNDLSRLGIVNDDTDEYVSIIPQFGANINELVMKHGSGLIAILDGNTKKDQFKGSGIFNSAKLLPFPNRIENGIYSFNGQNYQLEINYKNEGNAIHGLIYDKPFELIHSESSETFAEIVLAYQYDARLSGFPFKYKVEMVYRLEVNKGLICKTNVLNTDNKPMPFGDGWHPFFSFNKSIDDLYLKFSAEELILVDDRLIPTGEFKKFDQYNSLAPIKNAEFDTCFLLSQRSKEHTTEIYDPETNARISIWQETGPRKYNYLQIYTPLQRKSIAIEPMTCNVNAFNNHKGLIILNPGEHFRANYGIRVD
jgi:aldose 1-epimerase